MSDSAQAVAAVMVAKTLPAAFVTPVAGPIIDRFDRKKILIASDIARAVCVVGLIAAHRAHNIRWLVSFTVLMMLFSGIVFPTKSATIPMIVAPKDIAAANAMSGGTWSVMLAVGAALGGGATQLLGVEISFIVDGVTFLVSTLFFLRLPKLIPPAAEETDDDGKPKRATFADGLLHLVTNRYTLAMASLKPMLGLSVGAAALMPLIGRWYPSSSGPAFVGLLFAARGAGALTGSMLLRLFVGDALKTLRNMVLVGYALAGTGMLIVALAGSYAMVAFGFYVAAIGSGSVWVNSGTIIQHEADKRFFGRVFSIEFGATTAMIALSSWLVSYGVDHGWNLSNAATACGAYVVLPIAVWWVVKRHRESE